MNNMIFMGLVEKAVGVQHAGWICWIICLGRQAGENEKAGASWPISAVNTSSLNVGSSIVSGSEWCPGLTNKKGHFRSFLVSCWGRKWHKMEAHFFFSELIPGALVCPSIADCFPLLVEAVKCLGATSGMSDGADAPCGMAQHRAVLVGRKSCFWSRIVLAKVILLAADRPNLWPQSPEESIEICQTPASPLQKNTAFSQCSVEKAGWEDCAFWLTQQLVKFRGKQQLCPPSPPRITVLET